MKYFIRYLHIILYAFQTILRNISNNWVLQTQIVAQDFIHPWCAGLVIIHYRTLFTYEWSSRSCYCCARVKRNTIKVQWLIVYTIILLLWYGHLHKLFRRTYNVDNIAFSHIVEIGQIYRIQIIYNIINNENNNCVLNFVQLVEFNYTHIEGKKKSKNRVHTNNIIWLHKQINFQMLNIIT